MDDNQPPKTEENEDGPNGEPTDPNSAVEPLGQAIAGNEESQSPESEKAEEVVLADEAAPEADIETSQDTQAVAWGEKTEPLEEIEDDISKTAEFESKEPDAGTAEVEGIVDLPLSVEQKSEILQQVLAEEGELLEKDRRESDQCRKVIQEWQARGKTLNDELIKFVQYVDARLVEAREKVELIPFAQQAAVANRQEALNLVGKMLNRRLEAARALATDVPEPFQFPEVDGDSVSDVPEIVDPEEFRREIQSQLRVGSNQRWQKLREVREGAQQRRKAFLGFLDGQLLPCIDPLYEGETYSKELLTNSGEEVKEWFAVFSDLQGKAQELLEKIAVKKIEVSEGHRFDERRHEPIGVVEKLGYDNETVAEIKRFGYETNDSAGETILVRPATVVVVKNGGQE